MLDNKLDYINSKETEFTICNHENQVRMQQPMLRISHVSTNQPIR